MHGLCWLATKMKGKITQVFLSRIMVRYWPFPVRKDMGGMPQVAERVKYIK